ncbi:MAG: hypothetical protein ACXVA9_01370 [Bdellovibrionales bacterium]
MFKKISLMASLVLLAGCHSNPYSDTQGRLTVGPPEHKPAPVSNFYVDVVPKVDVIEGGSTAIKVKGVVPTGDPVLRYENLPSFCTADSAGTTVTCSPQFGDATDPKLPNETTASYVINVNLSSTDAPAASVPQNVVVIVHHVARGLTISGFSASLQVDEGAVYQSAFQITSQDFPQGPFTVSSSDLPNGVKITGTNDPTRFNITYMPGFTTVTTMNRGGYCGGRMCNNLSWKLTVVDPRGFATYQSAFWQVVDVRQNPVVVTPSPVIASFPNAEFYVQVEDPNGEVAPKVTNVTTVGKVAMTVAATSNGTVTTNPYSMMHIAWTGNPPASKGTTQVLSISSCVLSDVNVMNQCVTSPVNVQF